MRTTATRIPGRIACIAQIRSVATAVARSVVCEPVWVLDVPENPVKADEPIEMQFGGRLALAQRTMCYMEMLTGATWGNATEPSVHCGDASLSQITFTTY